MELIQQKHSCNISDLLPAYLACTDVQILYVGIEYTIAFVLNESDTQNTYEKPTSTA